jgi:hypothetical protein
MALPAMSPRCILTGPAFATQSREGAVVNSQAYALVAAVVGSILASAERKGSTFGAWGTGRASRAVQRHRCDFRCCSVRS